MASLTTMHIPRKCQSVLVLMRRNGSPPADAAAHPHMKLQVHTPKIGQDMGNCFAFFSDNSVHMSLRSVDLFCLCEIILVGNPRL